MFIGWMRGLYSPDPMGYLRVISFFESIFPLVSRIYPRSMGVITQPLSTKASKARPRYAGAE